MKERDSVTICTQLPHLLYQHITKVVIYSNKTGLANGQLRVCDIDITECSHCAAPNHRSVGWEVDSTNNRFETLLTLCLERDNDGL